MIACPCNSPAEFLVSLCGNCGASKHSGDYCRVCDQITKTVTACSREVMDGERAMEIGCVDDVQRRLQDAYRARMAPCHVRVMTDREVRHAFSARG